MNTYRALAAKRDQRAFLPRPVRQDALGRILIPSTVSINRVIGFGYVDPERAAPPPSVPRRRPPLSELVRWETW